MEKKFKLLAPKMPNFIRYSLPLKLSRNGIENFDDKTISVESLTEEEAIEFGDLMKQTFIDHWKKLKQ